MPLHPPAAYRHAVIPGTSVPGTNGVAPDTRFQEWFSWTVVASIAASAGFVPDVPSIDRNKVDLQVSTWRTFEGRVRTIGLQLKATRSPNFSSDRSFLSFPLERDHHNELVTPSNIPRFLVVVAVPGLSVPWVRARQNILALSAAAWWIQVAGPAVTEQDTKTIRIPTHNRFDVPGLLDMLRQA